MSRIAKKPIVLPKGVELNVQGQNVSVKGPKGTKVLTINDNASFVNKKPNE